MGRAAAGGNAKKRGRKRESAENPTSPANPPNQAETENENN